MIPKNLQTSPQTNPLSESADSTNFAMIFHL